MSKSSFCDCVDFCLAVFCKALPKTDVILHCKVRLDTVRANLCNFAWKLPPGYTRARSTNKLFPMLSAGENAKRPYTTAHNATPSNERVEFFFTAPKKVTNVDAARHPSSLVSRCVINQAEMSMATRDFFAWLLLRTGMH